MVTNIEDGILIPTAEPHAARSDRVSFAADLLRLERHYRSEAERLRQEAADARKCAAVVRQWRCNLAVAGEGP